MTIGRRAALITGLLVLAGAVALATADLPVLAWPARAFLFAAGLLFLLWLAARGLAKFLWRVGRRLAFSYLLIGVLPIPMVALLFLLGGYIHSGFFLGHLYRDAVTRVHEGLDQAAEGALRGAAPAATEGGLRMARYRDGRLQTAAEWAPQAFPEWLTEEVEAVSDAERERLPTFVALADGTVTLAAAATSGNDAVLAAWIEPLGPEIAGRAKIAVRLLRADDPEQESMVRIQLGSAALPFQPGATPEPQPAPTQLDGAAQEGPPAVVDEPAPPPLWDRPVIVWGEISDPLRKLADGAEVTDYVAASLAASPRTVYSHLFSSSSEVDTVALASAIGVTGLLSTLYGIALVMALFMIFTLSQAVNRLSRATDAVRSGDFSARIPVRRRDQVGELQRTFNEMAANLQSLVASEAQKEVIEKELEIARDLQQSLLPQDLPEIEGVRFATLFEPSSAIGGDYFDILSVEDGRLAVVIADVSGHGLPTGLRMAMVKAALTLLVEEGRPATQVLGALDRMVRQNQETRFFVTLTLAIFDPADGSLELTNAGHPPTYILRAAPQGEPSEVEEIELPSPPLGALGTDYGRRSLTIRPGDRVVWLSDGLIEATDAAAEPFGFSRLRQTLAEASGDPEFVRTRLLESIAAHTGGHPGDDDRTLVVMGYKLGVRCR